jgi:hypothetical protein
MWQPVFRMGCAFAITLETGVNYSRVKSVCGICGREVAKGRCVCDECAATSVKEVQPGAAEGATSNHFGRHVTDEEVVRDGLLSRWPRGPRYGAPVTANMAPKKGRKVGRRKL